MKTGYAVERVTLASRVGGLAAVLLAAVLASAPWWAESSTMRLIVEFICYLMLAQMWNLLAGYGGLISIGQQAFFGIGGYALFVLANHWGVNPFLSILLAGFIAAAFAVPTSLVVFRLHGGYFAVGTWVVAEVYRLLAANTEQLGGGSGQSLRAMLAYSKATRESLTYWIALAIAVGGVGLIYWLLRSRFGLALTAIRDSEAASESQGIDVKRYKRLVYLLAAFGCGLIGALYYINTLRIAPDSAFDIRWTAAIIFIVVIGGIGTIEGPIIGTLIYFLLQELLSDYGSWYLIGMGLIAVVVMVKWPRGLWGYVQQRFDLRFFPVQRRLRLHAKPEHDPTPSTAQPVPHGGAGSGGASTPHHPREIEP
jgi:branched-chain amino acid transport system permease protein